MSREKEPLTFELIVGKEYEFTNNPRDKMWSAAEYIGQVPTICRSGQYRYLAYDEFYQGGSVQWYEYARQTKAQRLINAILPLCGDKTDEILKLVEKIENE